MRVEQRSRSRISPKATTKLIEVIVVVLLLAFHLVMRQAVADVVLGRRAEAEQGRDVELRRAALGRAGAGAHLRLQDRP